MAGVAGVPKRFPQRVLTIRRNPVYVGRDMSKQSESTGFPVVTFRCPPALLRKIDRAAAAQDRTRTYWIVAALKSATGLSLSSWPGPSRTVKPKPSRLTKEGA